jgi:hypothetical protein
MSAVDQALVERVVRAIVEADRGAPGTAREIVLALIGRFGPDVVKPPPRTNAAGLDVSSLIA